jgi:hypothetical protein
MTAGAMTAAAIGSVPTANASCASFFGIGSGGLCSSTLTSIAIAIGTNAEAHADGIFGAAITLGNSSSAFIDSGALLNLAFTQGNSNMTSAGGLASIASVGSGINQLVQAGIGAITSGDIGNFASSFASPDATQTIALGIGNLSMNLAGSGYVGGDGVGLATLNVVGLGSQLSNGGVFNTVANVSGNNNKITNTVGRGGIGNLAFNVIGNDNVVRTGGTLAVAGAIGSIGQTVNQDGFGVNIAFGRRALAGASSKSAATTVSSATSVIAPAAAVSSAKSEKAGSAPGRAHRHSH